MAKVEAVAEVKPVVAAKPAVKAEPPKDNVVPMKEKLAKPKPVVETVAATAAAPAEDDSKKVMQESVANALNTIEQVREGAQKALWDLQRQGGDRIPRGGKQRKASPFSFNPTPEFTAEKMPWAYAPIGATSIDSQGQYSPEVKVLTSQEIAQLEPPFVVIHGVQLKPVEGAIHYSQDNYHWRENGQAGSPFRGVLYKASAGVGTHTAFNGIIDGVQISFLLDDKSSVIINRRDINADTGADYTCIRGHRAGLNISSAVLENSVSVDDVFIGSNLLRNIDSKAGVFNNSSLIASSHEQGPSRWGSINERRPSRYDEDGNPIFVTFNADQRHKFDCVRLRHASVENAKLSKGAFVHRSTVTDSTIQANQTARLTNTYVVGTYIEGRDISVKGGQIYDSRFVIQEGFKHHGFSSRREEIQAPALFMNNKFAVAKITSPNHGEDLSLVRLDKDTMGLYFYHSNAMKFPLSADEDEIRKTVRKIASMWQERDNSGVPTNLIDQSIEDYVVDSIVSRLSVINILAAAETVVRDYTHQPFDNEWFSAYEL